MSAWNRDDIIRMARKAGAAYDEGLTYFDQSDLHRFAALVAAHKTEVAIAEAYRCGHEAGVVEEREACAKACDELFADVQPYSAPDCAAAIRARGNP